jgi:hypothetical protein
VEGTLLASLLMHAEELLLTCCNLNSICLYTTAQIIRNVKICLRSTEGFIAMETGNMIFGTYVSTNGEICPIRKEIMCVTENWLLTSLIMKNNRFLHDEKSYLYPLKPTSSSILPNFISIDNDIKTDNFYSFISTIINPEYFPFLRLVDLSYCAASEREIRHLLEALFCALSNR